MKPLILVTNDDGIFAPGIRALVEVVSQIGEVVVVAPDSPQSGKGHAITIENPLRLHKVKVFESIEAYECTGTPVDCVKLAKSVILKHRKIDFCVSGINHGSNASINIIYSGTMSAAMEAAVEGIPSVGFSLLDYSFDANFEECKPFIHQLVWRGLKDGLGKAKLLNVNIPKLAKEAIKGMKICRQAAGHWVEEFVESRDPRGQPYYWLTGSFVNPDDGEDTDIWALQHGYISIVPSTQDMTDYSAIDSLKYLEK